MFTASRAVGQKLSSYCISSVPSACGEVHTSHKRGNSFTWTSATKHSIESIHLARKFIRMTEESCIQTIKEIGDKIRELKALQKDHQSISELLPQLKCAKEDYKRVTGKDYDKEQKKKEKEAKKLEKQKAEGAKQAEGAPEGTKSKAQLKKEAKMAQKAAKKAGKAASVNKESQLTTSLIQSNGKVLTCHSAVDAVENVGGLACLLVAKALGLELSVCQGAEKFSSPSLTVGNTIIAGTGAICRFLCLDAKDSSFGTSPDVDVLASSLSDLLVDETMEYLENELYPKLLSICKKRKGDNKSTDKKQKKQKAARKLPTSIEYIQKYDEMSSILKYCTVQTSEIACTTQDDGLSLRELDKLVSGLKKVGGTTVAHLMLVPALHYAKNWDSSILNEMPSLQEIMDKYPLAAALEALKNGLSFSASSSNSTEIPSGTGKMAADFKLKNEGSLLEIVTEIFTAAMHAAFPMSQTMEGHRVAEVARSKQNCDYQCNNAMNLFKALSPVDRPKGGPLNVGKAIVESLPAMATQYFESTVVSGPGFINIIIKKDAITKWVIDLQKNGIKPPPKGGVWEDKPLNIAVDFSSPNIAKEMHVGHLRSTIIGETLCRTFEFCGHNVKRINHVGDWGTQFGMLICNLEDTYPDFTENQPNITDLTQFYKAAKKRFDDEPDFKTRAQKRVVELQAGEANATKIWKLLCDISREAFDQVYQRLDVKLEEFGESYYNNQIPAVIRELEQKGLTKDADGAVCVFIEGRQVPLMVRKRDGGFGYDSTDIAAIKYRLQKLKSDWIIYITDDGQSSHFDLVFEGAKLAGWYTAKTRVEHIGFGVVQGEDGKRFRTRSGETVRLVDLLDEAKGRAIATLQERIEDKKSDLTPDECKRAGELIGYGCVKYFDLRQNPGTNYKFSYDKMLDPQGDTAVQLIYAYARGHSVIRKAEKDHGIEVSKLSYAGSWKHQHELDLAFEFVQFQDMIIQVVKDLSPNVLCNYLRNLVSMFTAFYRDCPVMKDEVPAPVRNDRLILVKAFVIVAEKCFNLLSIDPPKKI